MERKIGEIFNYQDNWYQCIENTGYGCIICHFNTHNNICCNNCAFYDNFSRNCKLSYYINHYPAYSCLKDEIFVEIKQNKENMEEREYSEEDMKNNPRFKHHKNIEQVINMQKMKPFDLEAAKAGKPVCTRDGRKARIICFDAKCIKPIVALIQGSDNSEQIEYYTENGVFSNGGTGKNRDLMILLEKKEGWVNIYEEEKGRYCSNVIYSSKEEALNISKQSEEHITTIKIEWEE